MTFKHFSVFLVCVCICERVWARVVLHTLPNIIMTSQGYFPLSGLALPAGVDWEKIRAYSLDYKKSCKQSHIVATGKKNRQLAAWRKRSAALAGWLAEVGYLTDYLVSKVVDLHFGTPQLSACFWLSPPGIRVRSDQAIVTSNPLVHRSDSFSQHASSLTYCDW